MEPTVDLSINSATGNHRIVIVLGEERTPLGLSAAAKLAADISTVISFAMKYATAPDKEDEEITEPARLSSVPDRDLDMDADLGTDEHDEPIPAKVVWHRREAGSGQYVADLPGRRKALAYQEPNSKGWNVKVGNKKLNRQPLRTKADAYEQVTIYLNDPSKVSV
jgi:hypothetical protein